MSLEAIVWALNVAPIHTDDTTIPRVVHNYGGEGQSCPVTRHGGQTLPRTVLDSPQKPPPRAGRTIRHCVISFTKDRNKWRVLMLILAFSSVIARTQGLAVSRREPGAKFPG